MDFPWISMDPWDLQAWAVAEPALIAAQWRNETPEVERPPAPSLVSGHCSAICLEKNDHTTHISNYKIDIIYLNGVYIVYI